MSAPAESDGPKRQPTSWAEECDSEGIDWVSLYKPKFSASSGKKRSIKFYHLVFLAIYVFQAYWVASTIGEPYRKFLEKADREGFQVMEGSAKMRAELEFALSDINDPDRPKEKLGWFDWMEMDVEDHAERKKREKERTVLDSLPKSMRVPGRYAAAFTPCLISGILVTLHLLIVLLQVWSVGFNVWINYKEIAAKGVEVPDEMLDADTFLSDSELGDAANGGVKSIGQRIVEKAENAVVPSHLPTHARVTPTKGHDVLVPLLYLPTLGLSFEYHRRRYVYDAETGVWSKVRARVNMPTAFFPSWSGFTSPEQVTASHIRFGRNVFDVRQPTFKELYKAQLLSPFTVFQLFCVVLWMLDDYWQYSAFTLCMILMFEGTVVFSRIKCMSALRGMGNKPRPVLVYRMGRWQSILSFDLLPGDVMSLTRHRPPAAKGDKSDVADKKVKQEDEGGDIVSADVLLLRGSCVVNEASLTGESVPQMKEGLHEIVEGEDLSMKTTHKGHVLYAGTKILQCKGIDVVEAEEASSDEDVSGDAAKESKVYGDIPKPHDGGCLCFVLRTGFSSGQGKLVRMIEGSQEKVKGHEKETALLLLLLFIFAVISSSYVLYHGIHDENRSQYELLLHCILIITSVIPPELPMQMALAVNNSLMTLMKMQVFCTEPYRVPMAGKLDSCLFDKTGTLTTDELVAVGVFPAKALEERRTGNDESADIQKTLTPMIKCGGEAALVLAGCHSLVMIDGETTGDPLESAALGAMRWGISKSTGNAEPLPATDKKQGGKAITVSNAASSSLEILARHHFSSKLQRMSCVVKDVTNRRTFAVVKGSPEAVGNLLEKKPEGYDSSAKSLSKSGYRVIALAYKTLRTSSEIEAAKNARTQCEGQVIFAGFIAFTCRVRKDTKLVLKKLRQGGMSIAMVTGDALLTAAHVAKEVAICDSDDADVDIGDPLANEKNEELKAFLQSKKVQGKPDERTTKTKKLRKTILILEQDKLGMLYWQCYDKEVKVHDYIAAEVPELAKKYDLATTGKNLAAAFESDEGTTSVLAHFSIFARMTPDAKEKVIECLHSVGALCLMCGDGANDVGALKQADVGVALLSGFGDVNVDKGEDGNKKKDKNGALNAAAPSTAIMNQQQVDALRMLPVFVLKAQIRAMGTDPDKYPGLVEKEDLVKLYQIKAREVAIKKHNKKNALGKANLSKSELKAKQRSDVAEKQRKMALRVQELEAQGEQWAQFKAMKEFMAAEMEEGKKKKVEFAKKRSVEGSAATMVAQFEDLETDELPMVKLGDASIAAPFTSKVPSIRSCVDIVRQGRCTLVTSIQMYQIMALNCLISSYSLSVLYLDGIKYGDKQMTAMGMLMSVSFMSVSRSKPLEKLSPVKPLTSIFHPSLFISLLGQFSVHLVTMMLAVKKAKEHMPADSKVDLDGEFKPGIFNSVVFLVSNVQQVTVFVVNLQGRPFMNGLTENRPLLWSLLVTFILTFMFASETVPSLNKYFQLVPFPDEVFRDFILKILATDVVVCFVFDRLMKFIFCRKILFASVEGTTTADVMKLARTIGVILGLMYLFLGNDDQWEEMLREEGYYNVTDSDEDGSVLDSVKTAVETCVGAACGEEMGGDPGDSSPGSEL
uniref:P-type ATPase A domain-containing protein n=1 Tax=Odontella aurita TaxID=265563 RepID=A0A7S4HIT1_9STRA|mmetsp:Transcript_10670/g.31547  ORF Transcript_10670/g.31547 Transcript_10670/m.31547 type:complete len:1616 (+) Transcript_10670:192-5039(+)|eukprot:CAMPEP_0113582370 /NCGR_PEP_ID=MMETSP0015_2-20120614/31872_1 /TAXON_ID=2838 /ORGANISM="Odontella" /LENGTH=1615 /DNA_ID=CAMNT_0000487025 /DNA_START=155 /DNA_END=5002 /DNA_ORIENTATION=+ /assembly_acc=CAM_ASM_000160